MHQNFPGEKKRKGRESIVVDSGRAPRVGETN